MKNRSAIVRRKTKETDIDLRLNLDGTGKYGVDTGIPFLDHMLALWTKHGLFDLKLRAIGDIKVDLHHTVEDIGICLGGALDKALGEKERIRRYGLSLCPMDESLAQVVIDISGRPYLQYKVKFPRKKIGGFDTELIKEFFGALTNRAAITLHINLLSGDNSHHIAEAIFKAFALALDQATRIDSRKKGVPSTKGLL